MALPTLVQHATADGTTLTEFSYSAPPTAGNLLIVGITSWRATEDPPDLTTGWTRIHKIDCGGFKFAYRWVELWYRVAETGDGTTWDLSTLAGAGSVRAHVDAWEWTPGTIWAEGHASVAWPAIEVDADTATATVTPPSARPVVLLAVGLSIDNDTSAVTALTWSITERSEADGSPEGRAGAADDAVAGATSHSITLTGTGAASPGVKAQTHVLAIALRGVPVVGVFADWDDDDFGDIGSDDDLTADVQSWTITRGASPEITGGATPGGAVITLNNRADDRYNPWSAGPLVGHLVDGVPVWIGLNVDGLLTGTEPRALFAGRVTDITPVPMAGSDVAPTVELSCEDALGWYGRTPVRLDHAEGRAQGAYRAALLAAAGETRTSLAHEIITVPLSSADGDLLPLLEEINSANGTRHWCHPSDERDDWYAYQTVNRQHGLDGIEDAALDYPGADNRITGSSGWRLSGDTVINRQKATVVPVAFTLGTVKAWEASELPIEVATVRPYEVFVDFDDYVDAPTLEIASTGSAITSSLTSFGVRGKVTMTVASGTGTVSALNVWGRLARRSPEEAHVANDLTSQAMSRGIRSRSDIAGDVVGTLASARGIAEHVTWRYGNPQMRPTVTVEDWFPEQLELDLYDILSVTEPQIGITSRLFEIVGLTHEGSHVGIVRTTYVLQECRVQTPTDWFILDSSLLDSTDPLAY